MIKIRGYFSAWKYCKNTNTHPQNLTLPIIVDTTSLPKWQKECHGLKVDENGYIKYNSHGYKYDCCSIPQWETKRKPKPFEHFTPIKKEQKREK